MTSPNPEDDKNKDRPHIDRDQGRDNQQERSHRTQSLHSRETQEVTPYSSDNQHETYPKLTLFIQGLTALFAGLAFAAAAIYACYAKQQVAKMNEALQDARGREAVELRAYVSIGTPQGQTVELIQPLGGEPVIRVHFINSGKTPARHFSILSWSSIKSYPQQSFFRTRWRGWGQLTNPGLGGQDATLGSESPYVYTVGKEYVPTTQFLEQMRKTAVKKDQNTPPFMLFGIFEYCDVFGRHHCDDFSFRYLADADRLVSFPAMPLCNMFAMMKQKPPPPVTIEGVTRPWTELPHCEQPNEVPEQ